MKKNQQKQAQPQIETPEPSPETNSVTISLSEKQDKNGRIIFYIVSAVILAFMLFLSKDAGMSGDEKYHADHAEDVINFYRTFGKDTVAVSVTDASSAENSREYGQTPDNIASLIAQVFHIEDIMAVRHFVNTIFGWLGILFASLLAYRMSGKWYAAIVTAVLLFLSPRYLGHSFNNLKDIPFAAMMMMGTYYIYRFLQTFPNPPKKISIMVAVSIGLAIGIRVGGLLLIAYFGLFALIYLIYQWIILRKQNTAKLKKSKNEPPLKQISRLFLRLFMYGLVICIAGYLLAVLIWPYALVGPVKNVYTAFTKMAHFEISIRQLFEGQLTWSDYLPWYYTPKFILMTIPLAVIIGILIYPFIGGWKKENRFNTFVIYFAFIFPVFWIIVSNANVYGGWRHALFAYPPMVVAAGLGYNALVHFLKNRYLRIFATALPFLLLVLPVSHIIRNHPYEYVYFNKLAGGMDNAYGNYEMDYYYHSMREASEWVIENAEKSGLEKKDKIRVASWHLAQINNFFRKDTGRFETTFCRWYERGNSDWDYGIFVITGMMPEQIKSAHFPPRNTVHTITVDKKPVCLVLKRDSKADLTGYRFKAKNQLDSALYFLKEALDRDPYNETALMNIMELYLQRGMADSVKPYLDRAVDYLPHWETSNFFMAHYYLMKSNPDEALKYCRKIIQDNFKFKAAYHLACNIYLQKNDLKSAEKILIDMIHVDQLDDQAVRQLIEIYKVQGLNEAAAYKKLYRIMAKSYENRGKKEEAEIYTDLYRRI